MRLPRLYRRAARSWEDVKRELEAAGVPRVGGEPEQDSIDSYDVRSAPSRRSRRPQGNTPVRIAVSRSSTRT